jgi:hypothetical protein
MPSYPGQDFESRKMVPCAFKKKKKEKHFNIHFPLKLNSGMSDLALRGYTL